jgi:hypothetical protein
MLDPEWPDLARSCHIQTQAPFEIVGLPVLLSDELDQNFHGKISSHLRNRRRHAPPFAALQSSIERRCVASRSSLMLQPLRSVRIGMCVNAAWSSSAWLNAGLPKHAATSVHCAMGDVDSALADLTRIESPYAFLHLWMGACLSGAGRDAEARHHIHEFEQKRPPSFDVPGFAGTVQRCLRIGEDRERFVDGLRKAGFAM